MYNTLTYLNNIKLPTQCCKHAVYAGTCTTPCLLHVTYIDICLSNLNKSYVPSGKEGKESRLIFHFLKFLSEPIDNQHVNG